MELLPVFSEGGVGRRGKCSVDEECDDLLPEMPVFPNLKSPLSFCPNWEADVLRERVPVGEKVGLSDLDDVEFMAEWTAGTIVRQKETEPTTRDVSV